MDERKIEFTEPRREWVAVCSVCGVRVEDQVMHADWHRALWNVLGTGVG